MGYTVPTTEPATLRAGDTWQWTRGDLSDYPSDTWTLTYYFRNATSHFNVVATADGSGYAVSVALATTAAIVPGGYDWAAFVTDGTDRYQVGSGRTEVLPDLAGAVPYDGRSFARRMLDAIESLLLGRATTDQIDLLTSTLGDRSITRDREQLQRMREKYKADVSREEMAVQGVDARRVLIRYGT